MQLLKNFLRQLVQGIALLIGLVLLGLGLMLEMSSHEIDLTPEQTIIEIKNKEDKNTEGKLKRTDDDHLILRDRELAAGEVIELNLSNRWVPGHIETTDGYWYFVSETGRKTGALSGRLARYQEINELNL